MGFNILLHPDADLEIDEAIDWLNERQSGLGKIFFEEYSKTRDTTSESPFLYPKIYKECRRAIIKRFPYSIIYQAIDDTIFILAVFHHKRNPKIWKDRAS